MLDMELQDLMFILMSLGLELVDRSFLGPFFPISIKAFTALMHGTWFFDFTQYHSWIALRHRRQTLQIFEIHLKPKTIGILKYELNAFCIWRWPQLCRVQGTEHYI